LAKPSAKYTTSPPENKIMALPQNDSCVGLELAEVTKVKLLSAA